MDFKKVSDLLKVIALLIGRVIIGTQNIPISESSQCLSLIEHLWEGRENLCKARRQCDRVIE